MPESIDHPLLDLSRMEMLRRIRIHPRGLAEGTFAGPHKSNYRGTSVEFSDYREYVDGDDIRLLDWKAYARTDRHYIRQYESERNLLSYAVVDTSASMSYAGTVTKTSTKLEYACRLAAAMGYLTVREGDEIGLSLVNEDLDTHLAPGRSWPHLANLLTVLENTRAEGGTSIGKCLEMIYKSINRRGILMIFSDFLDDLESLFTAVNLFRRSFFEVILFQIVHPEEIELMPVSSIKCIDPENSGRPFVVDPDIIGDLYTKRFTAFLSEIEGHAKTRGCDWVIARTDEDPYRLLKRCFLDGQFNRQYNPATEST